VARGDRTEQALARIRELEDSEADGAFREELRGYIDHRSNHVVARAARLASDWHDEEAAPHLAEAFERFMANPVNSDPGCVAKRAIVEALTPLGHIDPAVYLAGVRHVQMEPAFTERRVEDTAPGLRAASGRALLMTHYAQAYLFVIDLLNDSETEARRFIHSARFGNYLLYPFAEGKRIRLIDTVPVEGAICHQIRVELDTGYQVDYYIDIRSYLEVKVVNTDLRSGSVNSVIYKDYIREFGMPIAKKVESFEGGEWVSSLVLDEVKVNSGVMPWMFHMPE